MENISANKKPDKPKENCTQLAVFQYSHTVCSFSEQDMSFI